MMQKQWDSSMTGPTCMKYQVLFDLMDRQGLKDDDWWEMFSDIRSMESAALEAMHDNKTA